MLLNRLLLWLLQCIYKLVDLGCNVDAVNYRNETALHVTVRQNLVDCVMGLLAKGANAACFDADGNSPLHLVIEVIRVTCNCFDC